MASNCLFKNRSGQALYVEFGKNDNLTDLQPKIYDNEFDGHARLVLFDVYGSFYPIGEEKPVFYFRHTDIAKNKYRFANILELGDNPLDVQKGSLCKSKIADSETLINGYRKISNDRIVYGFDSSSPVVEYRLDEDGLNVQESDFFSLKAEPWPITIFDHQSVYKDSSVIFQPSTFYGVLDGKPFMGLGSYDRFCMKQNSGTFSDIPLGYTSLCCSGIREDGRKEMMFVSGSYNDDGKTVAIYYLEGEMPISTDNFELEADWYHLPYVNDGTCIFKNAIVRFCGKQFHFEGKWGFKGFTDKPRVEKHGQSQIAGTWYSGEKPYKHRISNSWVENMEAYDYKLKEWGFNVVD